MVGNMDDTEVPELVARAQDIVGRMQSLDTKVKRPAKGFSFSSMAVDDQRMNVAAEFVTVFNAAQHDPAMQDRLIGVVRQSSLSKTSKVLICPLLGIE